MPVYVKWKPPDMGTITLNTDRAFHATTHKAGFGGVFRNHKGEWIMGYAGLQCHRYRINGFTAWIATSNPPQPNIFEHTDRCTKGNIHVTHTLYNSHPC